jgi:hypothetical protein
MASGVRPVPIPRPKLRFTRLPAQGSSSAPVLVDLDGDRRLDVVAAGWDGRVHAWHGSGRTLRGWPVTAKVAAAPPSGQFRLDDRKLVTSPAVADLDGDGRPELVVRSQQFDIPGADIQPLGRNWSFAFHRDGTPVKGWPIRQLMTIVYYGSAQEFITEGANTPAVADIDGDRRDDVAISPIFSPTEVLGANGRNKQGYGLLPDTTLGLFSDPRRILSGGLPTDAIVSFTTSGAFGRVDGGRLAYAEPGSGAASVAAALLLTGSGLPITNAMRAFDARSGAPLTGFPSNAQGLDFLGGPVIADVTGDGKAEILQGGDSSALHAFGRGGAQAAGFPKYTTGWTLWSPAVGDVDGDGRTDLLSTTREGYLMAWRTRGDAAANSEWWSFRHDERNTSRHGTDTRPPSAPRGLVLAGRTARFRAPGDDWLAGTARRYVVRAYRTGRRRPVVLDVDPGGPAGTTERVRLPAGVRRVTVRAVDDAENAGLRATARR